jgi:predicted SAM-dependent methyltransferase
MSKHLKSFLHVGCGTKHKDQTTPVFASSEWRELRFDIDETVEPDITGSMLDMNGVGGESVDAILSSHNLEHLYPHEVPLALAEFLRVLKPEGYAVITCPDLQSVCELVAEDKLTDAAYTAPVGPVTPLDIIYGYRPELVRGNLYMAHRCGFTQKVLNETLKSAGFATIAIARRSAPYFDLWAVATKLKITKEEITMLARLHFMGPV